MCLFMDKENCRIWNTRTSLTVMFLIVVSVEMDTMVSFVNN